MEGVLTPEIWIAVAERTGIPELRRTTREEPDYDKLMKYRLAILEEKGYKVLMNEDEGKYKIDTGIGFLNHMLEQLSKHSSIE